MLLHTTNKMYIKALVTSMKLKVNTKRKRSESILTSFTESDCSKQRKGGCCSRLNDGHIDLQCSFIALSCQFSTLATLALELHQYCTLWHSATDSYRETFRNTEKENRGKKLQTSCLLRTQSLTALLLRAKWRQTVKYISHISDRLLEAKKVFLTEHQKQ